MMNNKYRLTNVNICTFEFAKPGLIRPMLNEFPTSRLCVIDKEKCIAIDVYHELKYDFLETLSMLSFINGASKKIKEGKRAAIQPIINMDITNEERIKASKIIEKLESGYEFKDGNDVLSNDEYLDLLEKERTKNYKPDKVLKIVKRKK